MEQQKKHPTDRVIAYLECAKRISRTVFGDVGSNDNVIQIAKLVQNEWGKDIAEASYELQRQSTESALSMNTTTTALAEAQIEWMNKQEAIHEMESANSEPLAAVGQPEEPKKDLLGYFTFSYYGETLRIPPWANFVTTNTSGAITAFEHRPNFNSYGSGNWHVSTGRYMPISNHTTISDDEDDRRNMAMFSLKEVR